MTEFTIRDTVRALDPNELGGGALLAGYLVAFGVLYRSPAAAFAVATASAQAMVFFLVLPAVGVLSSVYSVLDGPYSGVPVFVSGTYLGFVGLALTLGSALSPNQPAFTLAAGLVLTGLAVVAILASNAHLVAVFRSSAPSLESGDR